jgi:osmoprotectant transport system substrate-binding protein
MIRKLTRPALLLAAAALRLTGCSGGDPLGGNASGKDATSDTIVIGSQDYYSNEIIAEIYAQALESADFSVDRQFRIGQREVYLPEIESGAIDLFPEYTGSLLQYWAPDTKARLADPVYEELRTATPQGLRVLDQSPATDQDAYTVTSNFADEWQLKTIADLEKVAAPLTLGANSEAENRPFGPAGLEKIYGIENVGFTPIEDGGGPLTIKALQDDSIQLAVIYTANPALQDNKLIALEDTKGIFLAAHVVPLASDRLSDTAATIVNQISAVMSPQELLALNGRSVNDQLSAKKIAAEWLAEKGLL